LFSGLSCHTDSDDKATRKRKEVYAGFLDSGPDRLAEPARQTHQLTRVPESPKSQRCPAKDPLVSFLITTAAKRGSQQVVEINDRINLDWKSFVSPRYNALD
jgi:hypothetical protein